MQSGAPSRTAEYMALFRALESTRARKRRLVEDRAAIRFLRPRLRAVAWAARLAPVRLAIVAFIDRRWPGPRLSGVVRTRVIDDLIEAALGAGCTQLVLLGAGYDTRALRLAAAASAQVFEVDHPATQERKRRALGAAGGRSRYVPVDFERDALAPALVAAGLERGERSCVLWEGVFSYLTAEAIDGTLAALGELCARGSIVILTYVDRRVLEAPSADSRRWLAAVGDVDEPFLTGLDPAQAPAFFAARGLLVREDQSTTEAARRLGQRDAETIPPFYRLALLELGDAPAPAAQPKNSSAVS
ncbi:MAG TPA: SAM-dependent methyltransferase [Solirubrobacteraceae bacterium]|nr:SAM-dependent methyltransferase [Solirubrobacteraceae bacterium]